MQIFSLTISTQILQTNSYPNIDLNYKILPTNNLNQNYNEFFYLNFLPNDPLRFYYLRQLQLAMSNFLEFEFSYVLINELKGFLGHSLEIRSRSFLQYYFTCKIFPLVVFYG